MVASRQAVKIGQFTQVRFQNGVRLNVKHTDFAKDMVHIVLRFGDGRGEIENRDYLAATWGGLILPFGGIGKHSFEELRGMFQSEPWNFQLRVGDDAFFVSQDASRANLIDQLNVLAAYMSDPAFRASADPTLRAAVEATYRHIDASPTLAGMNALTRAVAPESFAALPPKSAFDGLNEAFLARLLKPSIVNDPIGVTIVGDIDEKTAINLVAASFGALPARAAPAREPGRVSYLRFPRRAGPMVHATHDGPADKAAAEAVWPLYVATPARRREEYAIKMVAAIFDDALRRRLRSELGKTYAPNVLSRMPDNADQGQLAASVESYPADIESVLTEMRSVARGLQEGQITAPQLEAARAPLLAQSRRALADNAFWAGVLSAVAQDDPGLRDALSWTGTIASIRLDEVKKAASDWLAGEPWTVVATPAASHRATP